MTPAPAGNQGPAHQRPTRPERSAFAARVPLRWSFSGLEWELGGLPKLMGIANMTPASSSDGGQFLDTGRAVDQAAKLVEEGADLIDVGGESTRPGAAPVSAADELARVLPAIERISRRTAIPISIDTTKAEVARSALDAGAVIVNDVSGCTLDPDMPAVCAQSRAGVVCMHMRGSPQTMQLAPHYNDVVSEVAAYLNDRLASLEQQGVPRERVVIDPGIGFGKTSAHNVALMQAISNLRTSGRPVLVGHSRKRFVSKLLGRPIDEVLAGTIGVSIALALQGVDILRVHDVRSTRDALTACQKILDPN